MKGMSWSRSRRSSSACSPVQPRPVSSEMTMSYASETHSLGELPERCERRVSSWRSSRSPSSRKYRSSSVGLSLTNRTRTGRGCRVARLRAETTGSAPWRCVELAWTLICTPSPLSSGILLPRDNIGPTQHASTMGTSSRIQRPSVPLTPVRSTSPRAVCRSPLRERSSTLLVWTRPRAPRLKCRSQAALHDGAYRTRISVPPSPVRICPASPE